MKRDDLLDVIFYPNDGSLYRRRKHVRHDCEDCNLVNETICLATKKSVIVVVGSWKGRLFTIQMRKPRQVGCV